MDGNLVKSAQDGRIAAAANVHLAKIAQMTVERDPVNRVFPLLAAIGRLDVSLDLGEDP